MLKYTSSHFKIVSKISKEQKNNLSDGVYSFAMYIIDYYSRVRKQLKLDYDSFILVQVVLSHSLYIINKKKKNNTSYNDLNFFWDQMFNKHDFKKNGNFEFSKLVPATLASKKNKLTISSICLITNLPKETVRRKIIALEKKDIIKNTKKVGITVGEAYKKIFANFVPTTIWETSKLINEWEKNGIIKNLVDFHKNKAV
jgi:hypothetical protein